MGNLSVYKYRPGVYGNCASVIALCGIFLLTICGGNAEVMASESDVIDSFESQPPYEQPQAYQWHNLKEITAEPSPADEKDMPATNFVNCGDPEAEAKVLQYSIEHSENRPTVISILSKCTRAERRNISAAYLSIFKEDLAKVLKNKYYSFFMPQFSKLAYALTISLPQLLTYQFTEAVSSHDSDAIISVVTTLVNDSVTAAMSQELRELKQTDRKRYQTTYGPQSFLRMISPKFRNIIDSQISGIRGSSDTVDDDAACSDAQVIREVLKTQKWKNDNNDLHRILMTTGFPQLRQIRKCFASLTGGSLEDAVKAIFSRFNPPKSYLAILQYAENKAAYFARLLNAAMKGMGTDNEALIFIIAWRADIDIDEIKTAYEKMYESSLYDDIEDDTSSDFRDLLLALVG